MKPLGIYVHIPFCRSKCPYCDFFSLADTAVAADYVQALQEQIAAFAAQYRRKADTLYIGGGTPSVLQGAQIAAIINSTKAHFGSAIEEITVECNPSDADEAFFESIAAVGANRLSFGMQSAVDRERRALGRRADRAQVEKAVKSARQAGIQNISLDVMLGIPGQSTESLHESIGFCAALGVQHISAYILKIEEGTYFGKHRERLILPDEDATADLYLQAVEELEKAGFLQYEISNFAKPGAESRHNLKYWHCEEYLGIGAAAHSFAEGKRFYYPRDIAYFIHKKPPIPDGTGGDRQEKIMLGLRLREGIDNTLLSESAKAQLPFLIEQGLIHCTAERTALTPRGCLLSNAIIGALTE